MKEDEIRDRMYSEGIYEADASVGKKFFLTFPYPYMNGYLHLGHLYSLMKVEVLARYKRMTGHKVLFPFAFHCTGMPIVAAAQRIREGEEKQAKILKMMGIPESEIQKFGDPYYWIEYFPREAKKDLMSLGLSIDFRRSFRTVGNKHYSAFIEWQFRHLRDKGYVKTGKHPAVWCPKDKTVVGDHARAEGEGVMPEKVVVIKFRMGEYVLPAGTLRPETVYGVTNLWLNPGGEYAVLEVGGEKWVASPAMEEKLMDQGFDVKRLSSIRPSDLIGKFALNPVTGKEVPILPAEFVKMDIMTGVVMSVPMHAPYDYQALKDLEGSEYSGLVKSIEYVKVVEAGKTAPEMVEDAGVTDQSDPRLAELTKHLYKTEYHTGKLVNCGQFSGKTVKEAKPEIIEFLLSGGNAVEMYELLEKVVCRCLTRCHVKIVDNQWFLKYSDPKWKELTEKSLRKITLYPEKLRRQFEHVIQWLSDWACARKFGLGTPLPWDKEWIIESLSDSTIYMAFYTVSHLMERLKRDPGHDLFDYVFLGKGDADEIREKYGEVVERMRQEFEYWYPMDFRNSGKDLVQNHLTMMLFNHTAIFPEDKWPRGIGVNGHVLVDGQKMSKSKGNFFTIRELVQKYGADATRFVAAYAGEGMDDANFDTSLAESVKRRLGEIRELIRALLGSEREGEMQIDMWFRNKVARILNDAGAHLENVETRSAAQKVFFDIWNVVKWYIRRAEPERGLMRWFVNAWLRALSVFVPFIAQEMWEEAGMEGWVYFEEWPYEEVREMPDTEEFLKSLINDIKAAAELAKRKGAEGKEARVYVAEEWKFKALDMIRQGMVKEAVEAYPELKSGKLLQKLMKERSADIPGRGVQITLLKESEEFLSSELGMSVRVFETGESEKAKASTPLKPGIEIL